MGLGRVLRRGAVELIYGTGRATDDRLRRAVAGRTVLITGASFGIGAATARRVARCGGVVLLLARSAERLHEVATEIRAAGGTAHAYPVDLTDPAAVDELAARLLHEHRRVDVLINNAGKSIRRSIELSAAKPGDYERTINVNYLGPVRLTMALLPAMRARGSGQVINVSTWGLRLPAAPRWSAYTASKGAFDIWFRVFGQEVRSAGIATTTVYMGLVHTRMSAPTTGLRKAPGLTPEQAAGHLCDALVYRPRVIEAPWLGAASVVGQALRGPFEFLGGLAYPFGDDTASAKAAVTKAAVTADR